MKGLNRFQSISFSDVELSVELRIKSNSQYLNLFNSFGKDSLGRTIGAVVVIIVCDTDGRSSNPTHGDSFGK